MDWLIGISNAICTPIYYKYMAIATKLMEADPLEFPNEAEVTTFREWLRVVD